MDTAHKLPTVLKGLRENITSLNQLCSSVLKKDALRNSTKFTGKQLRARVSFLLKKRLWNRCFPVNFVKFLRTTFSQNTSGRLLLKVPNNYRQLFVKDRKEARHFLRRQANTSKEYHAIPEKYVNLYQTTYLILASILPECFEFFLQIILQNTAISHAKRHIFSVCPNFVLSRAPQIPWQKHIPEQLFYRTAPCGCFQMPVIFLKKRKTNNSPISSELNPIQDGLFRGCSRMGGSLFAPPP